MTLLLASGTKVLVTKQAHDPQEIKYYDFVYMPDAWVANAEYLLDDIIVPAVPTGYYYLCINPGISGATEPSFGTKINAKTTDGTVIWKAQPYNLLMNVGDAIQTSTWSSISGDSLVISDESFTGTRTRCKVAIASILSTSFTLTNEVTILRSDSTTITLNRSVQVPVLTL